MPSDLLTATLHAIIWKTNLTSPPQTGRIYKKTALRGGFLLAGEAFCPCTVHIKAAVKSVKPAKEAEVIAAKAQNSVIAQLAKLR